MNVEGPMDRTKNRFCHRPVYPFKGLQSISKLYYILKSNKRIFFGGPLNSKLDSLESRARLKLRIYFE